MDKPKFVYVVYIATTPEKLWNALTDGEVTKLYWGRHRNASDWKVGSTWEHQDYDNAKIVDMVGKVLESEPPRRLVLTWALPAEAADPAKHSRVAFDIEPFRDTLRLTITHDELDPDSEMFHGISFGWPIVASSLKTLLETGQPFDSMTRRSK